MASTGSARGGGRISILYSFPHALGAPGIGWTAWNQVNELVRAGHDVHLVAASIARPVARRRLGDARRSPSLAGASRTASWDVIVRSPGTTGSPHVRSPADRPTSCTCGRSPRRARSRRPRRRGIPAFREVPNTHTANAYEVVALESARLGLTPRAGASHAADPKRLATEEREWATASALLVPSDAVAATFLERGFDETRLRRHRYGCTPAAPVVRPAGSHDRARRGLPGTRRTAEGTPPRARRLDRLHGERAGAPARLRRRRRRLPAPCSRIGWRTRASSCAG